MDGIKRSTKKFTTVQPKTMTQCGLKQKSSFFPTPSFFILISVPRIGDAITPEMVKQGGPRVIILHILLNAVSQPSKQISSFFWCKPKSYLSRSSFPKPYLVLKWVGLIFPEKATLLCLLEQWQSCPAWKSLSGYPFMWLPLPDKRPQHMTEGNKYQNT